MKRTQWVSFIRPDGTGCFERFEAFTPQDAMAECREKYPDCEVTGGGRFFGGWVVSTS